MCICKLAGERVATPEGDFALVRELDCPATKPGRHNKDAAASTVN
jgi:hypothetical protein